MKWWNRLQHLLDARGMTAADLARATRIEVKLIYKYLDGKVENPRGDNLRLIASALMVTEQELRYGASASKFIDLKEIPLLRLNEMGTLDRGQDPLGAWDGVSIVKAHGSLGDGVFGVEIASEDESNAPEIKPGDVVICDPSAPLIPGRFVVSIISKNKAALLRRYKPLGYDLKDGFILLAKNPLFPDITIKDESSGFIVSRVTKHIRDI